MKICAIRNEAADDSILAYLFYFEAKRQFFIELPERTSKNDDPIFFYSFLQKGIFTIDSEWSFRWVQQRIIPPDRQNLGMILKENHLQEYDEWELLKLSEGRCAQDDCAISPVKEEQLPRWLQKRRSRYLEMAMVLSDRRLLFIYRDGKVQLLDTDALRKVSERLEAKLTDSASIRDMEILSGGYGITWGPKMTIMVSDLRKMGRTLPLCRENLVSCAKYLVMDTADVCQELSCSRQYVNYLVKQGRLYVVKESKNNRLYLRSDVESIRDV